MYSCTRHEPSTVVAAGHVLVVLVAVLGDQCELDPGGAGAQAEADIADAPRTDESVGTGNDWCIIIERLSEVVSAGGLWRHRGLDVPVCSFCLLSGLRHPLPRSLESKRRNTG
jgi:hypothetical protein